MTRYGTAELYGFDFASLSPQRVRELSSANHKNTPCPFKIREAGKPMPTCSKKGGVCSLRQYTQNTHGLVVPSGMPVTTCPYRFLENNVIFEWIGKSLLGTKNPIVISEVPFLMEEETIPGEGENPVGKIDNVLVNFAGGVLEWCALEIQAVYFSGKSMENDFALMRTWTGPGVPFPQAQRRPDFRSSGPKRLMPQLQIKVPTISRWGKKMAVVVDQAFWDSLGEMRLVRDLSNSEIVWFVVSYSATATGRFRLQPQATFFTTLNYAVEGLTGGMPMSLANFEAAIRARLPAV